MAQAVKNAADRQQVKKAERNDRFKLRDEDADAKWVLSDPRGRRFVWRYLALCGVYKSSFTGSSETFFNEGKRVIGLQLMEDVQRSGADTFVTMMQENRPEAFETEETKQGDE